MCWEKGSYVHIRRVTNGFDALTQIQTPRAMHAKHCICFSLIATCSLLRIKLREAIHLPCDVPGQADLEPWAGDVNQLCLSPCVCRPDTCTPSAVEKHVLSLPHVMPVETHVSWSHMTAEQCH